MNPVKQFFKMKRDLYARQYQEINRLKDRDALDDFFNRRLTELLWHAYNHNTYYRPEFERIGLVDGDSMDLSRFSDIPVLTKSLIRSNQRELLSDDHQMRRCYQTSSGGSTGEPIRLVHDEVYARWNAATNYYYYKNVLGIEEPKVKKVLLWGSERDLIKGSVGLRAKAINRLSNTVFLNSYRMSEPDVERYITFINSFKPEIVRGYAGALYELCRYAQTKKRPLHTPKVVVGAAESLSEPMRETIESSFGTKVYNFYGSREVSTLAGECGDGLMHPFMFWTLIEVLDQYDRPVRDGESGRIVLTNLFEYSMPLIRYDIGDMAIPGPDRCSCGLMLPTLREISGRVIEHFLLRDGTTVLGEYVISLLGVEHNSGEIDRFQIIQEDYERIRILAVARDGISEGYKREIDEKIRYIMGPECQIAWEIVEEIPKTSSGKYLYTKSLVWNRE